MADLNMIMTILIFLKDKGFAVDLSNVMEKASYENSKRADSPFRHLMRRSRDILLVARRAVGKPAVILFILRATRRMQILAVITLTCLIFIFPPLLSKGFNLIFPPRQSKKLFGFVKNEKENPLARISYTVTRSALWVTAIGAFGLMFWLQIPVGVGAAAMAARKRESSADDFRDSDPLQSRQLYIRALALETDPERATAIRRKLDMLDEKSTLMMAGTNSIPDNHTKRENLSDSGDEQHPKMSDSPSELSAVGADHRYLIKERLGKGAMGVVYRAVDTILDREIALKELPNYFAENEVYVARFKREAQALARLSHPNIVQVYDLLEEKGRIWMTLEYLGGGDLAGHLKSCGRISINEALPLMLQVSEGLEYVHKQGIIHRDLKPSNILLTEDMIPKITDFGIAKLARVTALTEEGSTLGTPQYMSPEQCTGGKIDKYTDIYALGITFYELLTGRVPFDGETSSILAQHVIQNPTPPSEFESNIPASIESLILKMLVKDPEQRLQNMSDVLRELTHFREDNRINAVECK